MSQGKVFQSFNLPTKVAALGVLLAANNVPTNAALVNCHEHYGCEGPPCSGSYTAQTTRGHCLDTITEQWVWSDNFILTGGCCNVQSA